MLDLGAKVESMIIGTGTGVATDCCCAFSGGTCWNLWKLDKSQPFVVACRNYILYLGATLNAGALLFFFVSGRNLAQIDATFLTLF